MARLTLIDALVLFIGRQANFMYRLDRPGQHWFVIVRLSHGFAPPIDCYRGFD